MKKFLKIFTIGVIGLFGAIVNVSATDLSNQLVFGDAGLGNKIEFEKSYDSANDVTNVLVTVMVDEQSIDTALSQTSGIGSKLSVFYFELDPGLNANYTSFKKNNLTFAKGGDMTQAKADLLQIIPGENSEYYSRVWVTAFQVEYFDGTNWVVSDNPGNKSTSIRSDLASKLGIPESDLKYGENFRFAMTEDITKLLGWELDGNSQNNEFISINYELKFPISATIGNEEVMYTSITDALNSGSKKITINESMSVSSDVEIPSDVTLVISNGATLEITSGNKLINNGVVIGKIKVDGATKEYFTVGTDATNGTITVPNKSYAAGDVVTFKVEADKNYTIKEVTGVDGIKLESDGTYSFVMPSKNVTIKATFEQKPDTHSITIKKPENGTITVDKTSAVAGDVVTISTTANEGYVLNSVKVIDLSTNKEIEVKDGKFIMPNANVEISATFVNETVPATLDAISTYVIIGVICIGGLVISIKKFRRN